MSERWQGTYPVDALDRLPQTDQLPQVTVIRDAQTWQLTWIAFRPGDKMPTIDSKDGRC